MKILAYHKSSYYRTLFKSDGITESLKRTNFLVRSTNQSQVIIRCFLNILKYSAIIMMYQTDIKKHMNSSKE